MAKANVASTSFRIICEPFANVKEKVVTLPPILIFKYLHLIVNRLSLM